MIIGLIFCQQTGIFGEATLAKRGPKTAAGHAAVRYNAVTHGLLSSAPLIKGQEDQRDWDDLREGIMESLAPVGRLEEALADLVVEAFWRLRRVPAFEAGEISMAMEAPDDDAIGVRGGPSLSELRGTERCLEHAHELLVALPSMPDNAPLSEEDGMSILLAAAGGDESYVPATVPGIDPPCSPDEVAEWDAGLLRECIAAIAEKAGPSAEELTAWAVANISERLVAARAALARELRDADRLRRHYALPPDQTLNKIIRYGAHLRRGLFQTLHELEALQSRRRGEPALLTRLQVHGLPGA